MSSTERRWLELSVRSSSAGDESAVLAEVLVGLGGRAVQEEEGWFVTHLEEPEEAQSFLRDAETRLQRESGLGDVELRTRWIEHEDWSETWKRGLGVRRLTDRIVVAPTWLPVLLEPGEVVVTLDPGMAFGTAEHGTTRGCLRLLDQAVHTGQRLLDVGAGSGILGIAAVLLGADHVLAVEGDALALEALAENVDRNEVSGRVEWSRAWADTDTLVALGPVDGVLANIESGVLRPLLDGFAGALPEGGWLILSGILEEEWEGMCRATEAHGFALRAADEDGMWRSGWFVRGEPARESHPLS